ncbi:MAG TPA: FtsX-like permease family protein [bacterium]|nr:FtsX-like permease family protein [bacterium]
MRIFLSLALRNMFRNKKRSLITLAAVSFGLTALIFLRGFVFGAQAQMVQNITTSLTSDAQIVPAALENIYNTNGYIEDPEAIRRILRKDARIQDFAERVIAGGIVSSATNSIATFVVGFDPEAETRIGSRRDVVRGRLMTLEDGHAAAIGDKMREILGVDIGDKIVVTTQDYYGALAGEAFTLVGTFESGNDQIDNGTVMVLKSSAQRMMSLEHRVSKFAMRIEPKGAVMSVVQSLRSAMPSKDLKVLTWEELIPMMAQLINFQNGMIFVVVVIVLTVVAAGILNTLMMSIVERTREFGLMMAMGTKPGQVILLVALESFFITALGAVVGTALGVALTAYMGHVGIDLSRFVSTFSNFLIGAHVFPKVDWLYLAIFLAVVMGSNVAVSLYPAWRASRLDPVEAMRQVG